MKSRSRVASRVTMSVLAMAGAVADAAAAGNDNAMALEEVVVTARKTREDLQSTPVAVSAFTAAELELRGAQDVMDVAAAVPNLQFGNSASTSGMTGAPAIFMRGIGQADFIITTDPAVGMYVDGVYLARTVGALVDLTDIERTEVLRGPQGTLFGRNTIGGAINIISKRPTDRFGAKVALTLGQDDHREAQLTLNVPLSDTVRTRLTALYRKRDGYVRALQYPDLKLGDNDVVGVRGQLSFTPTEALTIDVALDHTRQREAPAPIVPLNIGNLTGGTGGPNTGQGFGVTYNNTLSGQAACRTAAGRDTDTRCFGRSWLPKQPFAVNSVWTDKNGNFVTPESKLDISGAAVTAAWNVGGGTLTSLTSYRRFESSFTNDLDFTPLVVFHNVNDPYDQKQFSEEIQYAGKAFSGRVDFVAGAYFFQEEGTEIVESFRPGTVAAPKLRQDSIRVADNDYIAGYGQATWHVTPAVQLTGGARWTKSTKDFALSLITPTSTASGGGQQLAKEWTPLVTVGWTPAEDLFLYGTFTKGFRDGGFPVRYVGGLTTPLQYYDPEYVKSYEVGMKGTWLDNRLRLNLAAFRTTYDGMQIEATASVPGPDGNPFLTVDNLANAELSGFEAEAQAVLTERLRVDLSAGYLDNKIKAIPGGSLVSGPFTVTTANELPFAPEWTGNLGMSYRLPIGSATLTLRGDVQYVGARNYRIENLVDTGDDAYTAVNASLVYRRAASPWEIQVTGRNLTDTVYAQNMNWSSNTFNTFIVPSRPRTISATFRYFFGDE